jgi:hypothetical protein
LPRHVPEARSGHEQLGCEHRSFLGRSARRARRFEVASTIYLCPRSTAPMTCPDPWTSVAERW